MKKTIQGTVTYTNQSFGFLETAQNESYFIPPQELKKVLPNDIVECSIILENDKEFVVIEKLITKGQSEFIGKVEKGGNSYFLNIENSPLSFYIHKNENIKEGDWIKCKLESHPFEKKSSVKFLNLVSKNNDERLYWNLSLAYNNIKTEEFKSEIIYPEISKNRRDQRDKNYFTVDGNKKTELECLSEKRDRDDAICIEEYKEGYKVYVAISDVAEYVKPNSNLDFHAKKNTTSYYLFDQVIPMLPRELSEEALSLNENVDRPVMVCELFINSKGKIKSYDFYEALINSKAQLSYDLVSKYFKEGCADKFKHLSKDINNFEKVGILRKEYREKHNIVFQNRVEYKLKLKNSKLENIERLEQLDSARYIEELMIASNHCFGKYMNDNNVKAIYNKFLGYSEDKKEELLEIISKYKLRIEESDLYNFKGYKKIQKKLLKQPENVVTLFNRCLEKAILSEIQVPHYGLGLEEGYATFTSPLRKYIDLINHRILKSLLRNEEIYKFNNEYLIELKENQLKQRKAENYIKQHLYTDYMYGKKNINYVGKVVFMNSKGAKIQIEENGVTGLLPFEEILKTNFEYIQSERIMNINSNVVKIGDVFNISLRNIDKCNKEINFKIV